MPMTPETARELATPHMTMGDLEGRIDAVLRERFREGVEHVEVAFQEPLAERVRTALSCRYAPFGWALAWSEAEGGGHTLLLTPDPVAAKAAARRDSLGFLAVIGLLALAMTVGLTLPPDWRQAYLYILMGLAAAGGAATAWAGRRECASNLEAVGLGALAAVLFPAMVFVTVGLVMAVPFGGGPFAAVMVLIAIVMTTVSPALGVVATVMFLMMISSMFAS